MREYRVLGLHTPRDDQRLLAEIMTYHREWFLLYPGQVRVSTSWKVGSVSRCWRRFGI